MIVHSYPKFLELEKWFEKLAKYFQAPSTQQIAAAVHQDAILKEWAALDIYIAGLIELPTHAYRPIPKASQLTQDSLNQQQPISLLDMLL